jgi:hypothetical protein
LIKLHHKERLAVAPLNCETAVAALRFRFRHTAQYRTELAAPDVLGTMTQISARHEV